MKQKRILYNEGIKIYREDGVMKFEGNGYLGLEDVKQLKEFIIEEAEQMQIKHNLENKKTIWKRFWKLLEKK